MIPRIIQDDAHVALANHYRERLYQAPPELWARYLGLRSAHGACLRLPQRQSTVIMALARRWSGTTSFSRLCKNLW